MPAETFAHGVFRIELLERSIHSACECGWRSAASLTAGLAGALWDRHRDELDGLEAAPS